MSVGNEIPEAFLNRRLADHLNRLRAADPNFSREWLGMGPAARSGCVSTLRELDRNRASLTYEGQSVPRLHHVAAGYLARRLDWLRETDFPAPPSPHLWIRQTTDREKLWALYREAAAQLGVIVDVSEFRDRLHWYGGVKSAASIAHKVAAFQIGREELDLWDLVRFRLVVPNIESLCRLTESLYNAFAHRIVRCRNYYLRPRKGWADPYRAIHYEVRIGDESPAQFAEIQIVTSLRETVGLIDHALVHRNSIGAVPSEHSIWLRDLSYSANIRDCQLGASPSTRAVAAAC